MTANGKPTESAVKRDKRSLQLAFQIVNEIGQNEFSKGQMLPAEHEMLEHYGVARATLREALRFLELQGMIKLRPGPGGGPVVLEPKPENFASALALLLQFTGTRYRSLIEVRQAISPGVAAYAAERASQMDIERLQASLTRLKSLVGASSEYVEEHRKFHDLLALASQNPLMVFLVVGLHQITNSSSLGVFYTDTECSYQINAYERILSAIIKRDPELASSEMQRFMLRSDRYLDQRYPDLMSKRIRWSDGTKSPGAKSPGEKSQGEKSQAAKLKSQHEPVEQLKKSRKREA